MEGGREREKFICNSMSWILFHSVESCYDDALIYRFPAHSCLSCSLAQEYTDSMGLMLFLS